MYGTEAPKTSTDNRWYINIALCATNWWGGASMRLLNGVHTMHHIRSVDRSHSKPWPLLAWPVFDFQKMWQISWEKRFQGHINELRLLRYTRFWSWWWGDTQKDWGESRGDKCGQQTEYVRVVGGTDMSTIQEQSFWNKKLEQKLQIDGCPPHPWPWSLAGSFLSHPMYACFQTSKAVHTRPFSFSN